MSIPKPQSPITDAACWSVTNSPCASAAMSSEVQLPMNRTQARKPAA